MCSWRLERISKGTHRRADNGLKKSRMVWSWKIGIFLSVCASEVRRAVGGQLRPRAGKRGKGKKAPRRTMQRRGCDLNAPRADWWSRRGGGRGLDLYDFNVHSLDGPPGIICLLLSDPLFLLSQSRYIRSNLYEIGVSASLRPTLCNVCIASRQERYCGGRG